MPLIKTSDGAQIHYRIYGHGPANFIYLHGWGGDSGTWAGVVRELDPGKQRAICVDLRGHGQSSVPAHGYTWETFCADVLAVADQECMAGFVVVGFSGGGKLACCLAAKYPARVRAQVLIAPAPPGCVPFDREAGLKACEAANDWQNNQRFFQSWFGPATAASIVEDCCQTMARIPCHVLQATAEMMLWTSLEISRGQLNLPTLLVTGQHDPVYNEAFQREHTLPYLNHVKTASLDSGHFIPLERPRELAELIGK